VLIWPTAMRAPAQEPEAASAPADTGVRTPIRQDPAHPLRVGEQYYPAESRLHHEEGGCAVRVQVDSGGAINALQLIISSGFVRLDGACLAAFVGARFLPATLNGKPVSSWANIPLEWRLRPGGWRQSVPRNFKASVPTIPNESTLQVGAQFYPPTSREMHQEGICAVHIVVDTGGALSEIKIAQSTGSATLDQACIAAVQQAHFVPGTRDGIPITAATDVYMNWRLAAN
jgi:TonB family protein